jgi:DNA repair protein RecN (Recombination protein N)
MLRYLRVRHFALIDQIELHFDSGFSLLSGETGAGKSILVDAIGLLAGAKASLETIRTGETRAVVEAVFDTDAAKELERLGIDSENPAEVIVKREISSDGRNRVFINNQPSTAAALKELAPLLLDIHGQHEQQTLLDPSNQLALIDEFAGAGQLAANVRRLDSQLRAAESELATLVAESTRAAERLDLLIFQRDEIQKAAPQPGETESSRERLEMLLHASRLLDAATQGYEALYESEASVISALAQTYRSLRDAAQFDKRLDPLAGQAEAARIQIEDLARGLRDYAARVEADPREVERLQSRLSELERLHRKYGPDLLKHLERVNGEMDSLGLAENQKEVLNQRIAVLREEYGREAAALRKKRRGISKRLEKQISEELQLLAMPNARFEIQWTDVEPGNAQGMDRADFLLSANPGEEPRPLARIASGGELSRVMLALRTVLVIDEEAKTLVFDEIDAGIGGKAAETVGRKLKNLSKRYQVLCVTHLAQIAAFADHQFRIEKDVKNGRTVTTVEPLSGEARVDELARMMSGSRVTDAARQHVKELLTSKP